MRKATTIIAVCVVSLPALAQRRQPHRARPVPIPTVLVNAAQCNTHLVGAKRAACTECIRRRGKFHTEGPRAPGVCRDLPAPPTRPHAVHNAPPPHRAAPPLPTNVLEQPEQCNAIRHPGKRERCRKCLHGRNWFFTQGNRWGYCKPRPAPPPPKLAAVVTSVDQCNLIRRAAKRERCKKCVGAGGQYFTQGVRWGYCKVRRAPPAPHRKDIREERRDRRDDRRERRKDRRHR